MEVLANELRERLSETEGEEVATIARFRLELVVEPSWIAESSVHSSRPVTCAAFARALIEGVDREVLGALFFNTRNKVMGVAIAYVGTISRVSAEPRGILVPALLANAAGVVMFHNHPSGDVNPSPEDLAFTRRMLEASEVVGVEMLDHIILGEEDSFVSLRERIGW